MDPFGDAAPENGDDLSNFQPPADAAANGDFYGSEPAQNAQAQPMSFDYQAAEASFMQEVGDSPAPAQDMPAMPNVGASPTSPDFGGIPAPEEENELTKFMAKYEQEVAAKAVEQEKVGAACREKAQTEMKQFLEERARAKQAKQASNRVAEQATLEQLAAELEAENPWERVVSLVDLETNHKQKLAALNAKKDAAPANGKKEPEPAPKPKADEEEDVSRMRQLFVQLKATPLEQTRAESVAAH